VNQKYNINPKKTKLFRKHWFDISESQENTVYHCNCWCFSTHTCTYKKKAGVYLLYNNVTNIQGDDLEMFFH
jgi:hypothetical protein